jgi:sugar lactone lactonase YvrE
VVIFAKGFSNPDDILLAPDGSLLVSDIGDGTVKQVGLDGSVKVLVSGLSIPEGIVILPDGSLVIAEQGKNRLVRFDPAAQTLAPFLNLKNKTGQDGVDGIALDAREQGAESILIPDSPNGILWRSSLDRKTMAKVASGFSRPTGAWVEPDGSLLVTDEYGGALKRVHPDGRIDNLAKLPVPDDVIEDTAGNIFVAALGDNAIHVIPAATQEENILVSGLAGPQGLAFDSTGNLVVTESGRKRLTVIMIRDHG